MNIDDMAAKMKPGTFALGPTKPKAVALAPTPAPERPVYVRAPQIMQRPMNGRWKQVMLQQQREQDAARAVTAPAVTASAVLSEPADTFKAETLGEKSNGTE